MGSRQPPASNLQPHSSIRLAELMAALSLATDLGLGQPLEFALSACVLAVRLAEQSGYSLEARRGGTGPKNTIFFIASGCAIAYDAASSGP